MKLADLPFNIITEDGSERMTISEYNKREELHGLIGIHSTQPAGRRVVFAGTTIASFSHAYLEQNHAKRDTVEMMEKCIAENPLRYFVPQTQSVMDFLNDTESTMKMLVAPNSMGKSVAGWVDCLLDIGDCDPSWEIFSICGVKRRPHDAKRFKRGGIGVVTYQFINHQFTIWPQVIKVWTPPSWIKSVSRVSGETEISWNNAPRVRIGSSMVYMLACSQSQVAFESQALNLMWWDEQGTEARFSGANQRTRRVNGRHVMSLTPHHVPGRPDTGSGSYIHKLFSGEMDYGLKVGVHRGNIFELPAWIMPEANKRNLRQEWEIEPQKQRNKAKIEEGKSRLHGEFQVTQSRVFDEFDVNTHVIEPFAIPKHWPRYRAVDHGRIFPTAALCATVTPDRNVIFYAEYFQENKVIQENVRGIVVETCGNKLERDEDYEDNHGRVYERMRESMKGQRFVWTRLDKRSFNRPMEDSTLSIGQMYRLHGLYVTPADGSRTDIHVNIVKDYMKVDMDKKHPYKEGVMGSPRVFFFSTLRNTVREILGLENKSYAVLEKEGSVAVKERPRQKDDHTISAMFYLLAEKLNYFPSYEDGENEEEEKQERPRLVVDASTGY